MTDPVARLAWIGWLVAVYGHGRQINTSNNKLRSLALDIRSALFVDSLSTNCAVFVDRLPAFRLAKVARHMY